MKHFMEFYPPMSTWSVTCWRFSLLSIHIHFDTRAQKLICKIARFDHGRVEWTS